MTTYVDQANTGADTFQSSQSVSKPAGVTADDVGVFWLHRWSDGSGFPTVTAPSGAVLRGTITNGTVLQTLCYLLKVSAESSFAFSWTGARWSALSAEFARGVDPALNLSAVPFDSLTGSGTLISTLSVTTVSSAFLGWSVNTLDSGPASHTPPTDFTEIGDVVPWATAYRIAPSGGSQSAASASNASSTNWAAGLVALAPSSGGGPQTQTFNATGSWQAPAGVTSVKVECWGAGGAGGRATGSPAEGGGGAGGAYARTDSYSVTPGNTYTVTVAAATGANTGTTAVNGGDSWFDSTSGVLAKGGAGGTAATVNSTNGTGGAGSTTGCVGGTTFAGGNGAAGSFSASLAGGAGGGGAGSTAAGGNASGNTGGTGGTSGGGAGASGVADSTAGATGTAPGGGGSGGDANSTTDRNGGSGAAGRVVLTWTPANFPPKPVRRPAIRHPGKSRTRYA